MSKPNLPINIPTQLSEEELRKIFPYYGKPKRKRGDWPWAKMRPGEVVRIQAHEARNAQRAVHTYVSNVRPNKSFQTKRDKATGELLVVCIPRLNQDALNDESIDKLFYAPEVKVEDIKTPYRISTVQPVSPMAMPVSNVLPPDYDPFAD